MWEYLFGSQLVDVYVEVESFTWGSHTLYFSLNCNVNLKIILIKY